MNSLLWKACKVFLVWIGIWMATVAKLAGDDPPFDSRQFQKNREAFVAKLAKLTWIAYTPSQFRPVAPAEVSVESIEADLDCLAKYFPPERTGFCTYGCNSAFGLDEIGRLLKKKGFAGHIQGVWSLNRDDGELETAEKIAGDGLCDALVLGNEGLDARYKWELLAAELQRVRKRTLLPTSTSERFERYNLRGLCDPETVDFLFPIVHPVHHRLSSIDDAVDFTDRIVLELKKRAPKLPVLLHETGWPSRGLREHSPENQAKFWLAMRERALKSNYPLVIFEAFDLDKREIVGGSNVGNAWGLLDNSRQPKPVLKFLRTDGRPDDNRAPGKMP